jgi:hypothetical protein
MFADIELFAKNVMKTNYHNPTVYLYAHNGGNFDTKIMLEAMLKIHKDYTSIMPVQISDTSHNIFQVDIKYKFMTMSFRDRLKLIGSSLERINKDMLGGMVSKLPINFEVMKELIDKGLMKNNDISLVKSLSGMEDISGFVANNVTTPELYLAEYCKRDTIIVVKALTLLYLKLSESTGLNIPIKFFISISSVRFFIFQHKFNNYNTPIMAISPKSSTYSFIKAS